MEKLKKAHDFLSKKGCRSNSQLYSAFEVRKFLYEFAKQEKKEEAVRFYEYMKNSKYIKYESGYRNFFEGLEGSIYSIEQLYEQFKKEQDEREKNID